jgi:putative transposase
MRFSFIDAKKAEFPVARLCEVLEVSQSGYFAWKNRPASERQCKDMVLLAHIRERFRLSRETYGSPRMHADLTEDGIIAGRHRIARLMRDDGLKARQRRRFKKTTDSNHGGAVAPNHLEQDFAATGPDQKWAADISYIWTAEGWLYLAIVLDLFSRRIIGWAVSNRLKKDLALCALQRALVLRRPKTGILHHSDRGSQYCSYDYQRILGRHGFLLSMSGKGNCYDNAMVEAVFKTIKSELIWRTSFQSRRQAENAIARYIDSFYNPVRRHSALGYKSPIKFEDEAKRETMALH